MELPIQGLNRKVGHIIKVICIVFSTGISCVENEFPAHYTCVTKGQWTGEGKEEKESV